jgi:hypothetical protein
MGAGRSGTTALATFLGNNKEILMVGELHQFFEHIEEKAICSCGVPLDSCKVWSKILISLPVEYVEKATDFKLFCQQFEYHSSIPKYILNRYSQKDIDRYIEINNTIFNTLRKYNEKKYFLDSAKYIGRFLGLKKSEELDVKTIYLVRDVRGVVNSFSKNVQSPRGELSTIFYWLAVNTVSELTYRMTPKKRILKIKYEDFIDNPIYELEKLECFLGIKLTDVKDKIKYNNSFEMSHIIGGNRIKRSNKIYFKADKEWENKYSKTKKIFYYLLASPIMMLNRFKI